MLAGAESEARARRLADLPLTGPATLLTVAIALAIVVYPLTLLLARAFSAGQAPFRRAFSGAILGAVLNTVGSSALATAIGLVFGLALALATERSPALGKPWLRLGISLPLLIPPFINAFSWTQTFGRAGLVDKLTHLAWPGVYGVQGTVALLALQALPLIYLPLAAGLSNQATVDLERAARVNGAGPLTMLCTTTLPLLRPYLAAGAVLAYVISASDFGVPAIVGLPGHFNTVTTEIYRDMSFATDPTTFATVVVLGGFLLLLAVVALLALRQPAAETILSATGGGWRAQRPPASPAGLAITLAVTVWVAVVSLLPLAALLIVALTRAYGLPIAWQNLTLANFGRALEGDSAVALVRSCVLAAVAASAVTVLGLAVALAVHRGRAGRTAELLVALPYAIPGSALAVAIILGFSRWLYGTLAIILVAYVARFWALGSRPLSAALSQLGPDPLRAARVSGASAARSFLTAGWPAVRPVAAAAWLLVFLTAVHELTVSSLLYTPATQTVAVIVLNAEQGGDVSLTAAISVLLTAIVLFVAVPAVALRRRATRLPA